MQLGETRKDEDIIMKFDGIDVTKTADGKIDRDALYINWLDKDQKEQAARFTAWEKSFLETMAVKGVWFPAIHEQLLAFLKNQQYQQQWLPLTLVTDMLYGSMLSSGKIPLDKASGIKELIGEYIESQCGDSLLNPEALLFSEGKKKGKGVSIKFRLNPAYRDVLNNPPPAAAPEAPPADAPVDESASGEQAAA